MQIYLVHYYEICCMSEKNRETDPEKDTRSKKKKGDVTKSEEVLSAAQSLILFSFFFIIWQQFL